MAPEALDIRNAETEKIARTLNLSLDRAGAEVVPVDVEQPLEARLAFSRFGKGRQPATLNYGDCFAYAVSRVRRGRLLFNGTDFSHTNAEPFSRSGG